MKYKKKRYEYDIVIKWTYCYQVNLVLQSILVVVLSEQAKWGFLQGLISFLILPSRNSMTLLKSSRTNCKLFWRLKRHNPDMPVRITKSKGVQNDFQTRFQREGFLFKVNFVKIIINYHLNLDFKTSKSSPEIVNTNT